jgi:hypothetical protein
MMARAASATGLGFTSRWGMASMIGPMIGSLIEARPGSDQPEVDRAHSHATVLNLEAKGVREGLHGGLARRIGSVER